MDAPSWPPPPSPVALDKLFGLLRPPGPGRVGRDLLALGPSPHHRVQDLPRPFGLVRPNKKRRIAEQEVEEEALVGVRNLFKERRAIEEVHVDRSDREPRTGDLSPYLHRDPLLGLDAHHQDVRLYLPGPGKRRVRCRLELDGDLRDPLRQPLARPDVERHSRPPPVVYKKLSRDVRLGRRVRRHVLLLAISRNLLAPHPAPGVLTPNGIALDLVLRDAADRFEDLYLLLAHRLGIEGDRRLHSGEAEDLHEVVLDDVAECSGLLVEGAAGADAYVLGYRDLDVVHVMLAPDGLEDAVGEPERQDILHRLLAKVVVYPVDLALPEVPPDVPVQFSGARQVSSERFLDYQPGPAAALSLVHPRLPEPLDNRRDERRRRCQVVGPVPLRPPTGVEIPQKPLQLAVRLGIFRVPAQVKDAPAERAPHLVRNPAGALLVQGTTQPLAKLLMTHLGSRDANDGELHRETAPLREIVERGDELAGREVTGGAEDHGDGWLRNLGQSRIVAENASRELGIDHPRSPTAAQGTSCSPPGSRVRRTRHVMQR